MGAKKIYRYNVFIGVVYYKNFLYFLALLLLISFFGSFTSNKYSEAATTLCSTTTATITQTSGPIVYIDKDTAPLLDSVYASYNVDTGASISFDDLWVQLENFTGGSLNLNSNEDGLYHVGPLTTASSTDVYFYLTGVESASPQAYDVVLYDGHPSFGGTETCYENRGHTVVEDTIKAVANKVNSVVSTAPYVGGNMTITVTGNTGTIGASGIFNYTPASVATWPADCYELFDTEITLTGGNTGTYYDGLYLTGLNPAATDYVVKYWFTAKCTTASPASVTPLNNISSGTQIKHTSTDTATYTSIPPIPPAENQVSLYKSVTPGGSPAGGTATYTVTVLNDSPIEIKLDYFQDILPSSPNTATYTASSSEWNSSPIADPNISGQQLTWTDLFTVPANSSRSLTYDVTIPATGGEYTNSAIAIIGATQIDLTKNTLDNFPATATYGIGDPNFGNSTKTSVDANGDDLVPGDTISYTLTLTNSGSVSATGVDVDDTIDLNTENLTNIVIGALATNCGSSYTDNSTATALNIDGLEVAAGSSCIITFDVSVKSGTVDQTSILNTATISAAVEGGVGGNPSSLPLTVDVDPTLVVSKVENDDDNNVTPGQTITYTITIDNTGLADATGVDILDTIAGTAPISTVDNFTFTNCGSIYVNNSTGTTIDIANVDVSIATNCVVTYDVTVDGTAVDTQTITNAVDVSQANEGGNDPGSVSATTLTVAASGADPVLVVTKTEDDADNTVAPGQTVTYTINIQNTGNEDATTSFTDAIDSDYGSPSNYSYTNCGGAESPSFSAPTLTVSGLVIAQGTTCVVTYSLVVDSPLVEGTTLDNSVDVVQAVEGGNNPSPVSATQLTVDVTPNLAVTKTENDNDNEVNQNQVITYTVTIINSGDGTATGVDLSDTITGPVSLVDNFTFTNCGGSYSNTSLGLNIVISDLIISTSSDCVVTYDITVSSTANDGDAITNAADVATSIEGGNDPAIVNASTLTVSMVVNVDLDGISDEVEGEGPNGGDVNGDGLPDNTQSSVSSLPNPENNNNYVSLESGANECGIITQFGVVAEKDLAVQNEKYDFPLGLFDFTIACTDPGDSTTITFFLDKVYDTSKWVYIKYDGTALSYSNLAGVSFGTATVGGNLVTTINYTATDGESMDEDKLANGTIVDPSGPAVLAESLSDTGKDSRLDIIIGFTMILSSILIWLKSVKIKN